MKLHVIEAERFKLDGGAMFGVVPYSLWSKLNPPDELHLCSWALRSLLVETEDRLILFDTGIGDKQGPRFKSHFHPEGKNIENALIDRGWNPEDITDVFITHLHFDHVGGALKMDGEDIVPSFPNATYWSCKSHYDWALNPNPRERASFLKENFVPLIEQDVLKFIPEESGIEWLEGIRIYFSYGHTHAMMIPHIPVGDQTVVYCADLLPSSFHVRMPYVMSYDVRPLQTLREKQDFYDRAVPNNYLLFLEHDPVSECCRIKINEKGRYYAETCSLSEGLAMEG